MADRSRFEFPPSFHHLIGEIRVDMIRYFPWRLQDHAEDLANDVCCYLTDLVARQPQRLTDPKALRGLAFQKARCVLIDYYRKFGRCPEVSWDGGNSDGIEGDTPFDPGDRPVDRDTVIYVRLQLQRRWTDFERKVLSSEDLLFPHVLALAGERCADPVERYHYARCLVFSGTHGDKRDSSDIRELASRLGMGANRVRVELCRRLQDPWSVAEREILFPEVTP